MRLRGPLVKRVKKLKISAKVSAASVVIVVVQGVLSLIGVSILITQTTRASFQGQLARTTHSVESFIDSTRSDLAVKANLLAGQQKIIDYTDYDLRNLLQQELSVMRLPLKADAFVIVDEHRSVVADYGDPRLITSFRSQDLAANWEEGDPLFIAPYQGQIHLWALSPIMRAKTVIGVLAIGLNLDSNFINHIEFINNTAVLLSWKKTIFVSGTLPETFFTDFVKAARSASPGTTSSAVGRYVLSTSKILSLQGLYVHCFVDSGDSSRLLSQYRVLSLVFLLVVILLGLATSLLLYRYTFLTPFRLLHDAIEGISAGNLGTPIAALGEDEFGELARSFGEMTRNLRERERELAELGATNALVLANVSSGILTVTPDGRLTAINPAARELLGIDPPQGEAGLRFLDAVPPELARVISESLPSDQAGVFREVCVEQGGTARILSVSASPFLTPDSARIGSIVVMTDVTREKELERKLELSSRMAAMGEMVAGVAHQIRTPLAIMKVSAELLRDHIEGLGGGDPPNRLSRMIVNEADKLGSVVNNFLDFARPYAVRKEPCRVEDLLRHVIDMLPEGSFPGTTVRCRFDAELPSVSLDRTLLEQVFRNLLMNALQASSAGQTVSVGAWRDDGHVVVEVRDDGPGMDESVQRRIFNPFFTTKSDGTGLGLSIVHRIVESHGSRIEMESAPGAGTAFRVHL